MAGQVVCFFEFPQRPHASSLVGCRVGIRKATFFILSCAVSSLIFLLMASACSVVCSSIAVSVRILSYAQFSRIALLRILWLSIVRINLTASIASSSWSAYSHFFAMFCILAYYSATLLELCCFNSLSWNRAKSLFFLGIKWLSILRLSNL
jgi:hypothetical protein